MLKKGRSWIGSLVITIIASSGCWGLLRFRDNFPFEGTRYYWLTVAAIITIAIGAGLIALWVCSGESDQRS